MDLETLERRTQSLIIEAQAARSRLFGLLRNVAIVLSPSGAAAAASAFGFHNRVIANLSDVWPVELLVATIWLMTPFLWGSMDSQGELALHRRWSRTLSDDFERGLADKLLSKAYGQVTLTAINENLIFWGVTACVVARLISLALHSLAI